MHVWLQRGLSVHVNEQHGQKEADRCNYEQCGRAGPFQVGPLQTSTRTHAHTQTRTQNM